MPYTNLIMGLDIGTTKVCAVIAETAPGEKPNITGVGMCPCTGLRKGIVVDIESTTAAIKSAVDAAERMAGERANSAVVGVTGEHISCLNSRSVIAVSSPGREISEHDVSRLLDNARIIVLPPDREIIHAIPRWYSIDGQSGVQRPVGMHGNRLEMETHIVTGLSSFLQNVVKCVNSAGIDVDGTVLEPIAAAESVLSAAEKELGVVLVDIGGGTSDVAVYVDGQVYYSGVIPVGGNHLTRDIAIGLRCSTEEAERIKLEFGAVELPDAEAVEAFEVSGLGSGRPRNLPRRVAMQILEPRVSEICDMVLNHIDTAGCRDRLPAGVVFTGGGARIRGLTELFASTTDLPARIGVPTGLGGLTEAVDNPSCATAAGLVLFWSRYHSGAGERHRPGIFSFSILLTGIRDFIARLTTH